MNSRPFSELPRWRQAILILLVPLVFPASLAILLLLVGAVTAWNALVYTVYWVRWALFGVAIPSKFPDQGNSRATDA